MKPITFLTIVSILIFGFVSSGLPGNAPLSSTILFETVEQGEHSFYRCGDPGFAGADLLIRDKKTWN